MGFGKTVLLWCLVPGCSVSEIGHRVGCCLRFHTWVEFSCLWFCIPPPPHGLHQKAGPLYIVCTWTSFLRVCFQGTSLNRSLSYQVNINKSPKDHIFKLTKRRGNFARQWTDESVKDEYEVAITVYSWRMCSKWMKLMKKKQSLQI